jgi:hypothetical protein
MGHGFSRNIAAWIQLGFSRWVLGSAWKAEITGG